jgi:hypothetical protein
MSAVSSDSAASADAHFRVLYFDDNESVIRLCGEGFSGATQVEFDVQALHVDGRMSKLQTP